MGLRPDQIFIYFFQSIGIFMSLFFFVQYFIIRRKEHLFYAIYLLSLWIYLFLAMPEYFFPIDPANPESESAFRLFKRPVQYLSSIFYTWFVIYYLGLEMTRDKVYRIFRILVTLYVIASPACFLLNYFRIPYDPFYFLFSLLLLPIQLYVLVALFREKIPYSAFIIWGSLITIAGSISSLILTIMSAGLPNDHPLLNFNIFLPAQICILIDIFLYSIALQKKIADTEKSLVNAAFQRQQAVSQERERIIADLHDDVGGGLSSIRMMSDLMVQRGNLDKAQAGFAEKISMTARDIAQRMHTIIWSLNQENDRLDNFLEYVRQYGASFFENTPVRLFFEVNTIGPRDIQLNGSVRKNLFLIVKEAMHNILKHSGATEAKVVIDHDSTQIRLTITDNGKGFEKPEGDLFNGFGNGLRNMHRRAEEIRGRLSFSSNNGLSIIVTIPLT